MKYLPAVLCLLVTSAQAEVYRSINEAGEIVFTDVPTEGAERVELPPLSTVAPPDRVRSSVSDTRKPAGNGPAYRRFEVATPDNEASIWDNEGNIKLGVLLEPALQISSSHKIQYFLDGQPYGLAEESLIHQYRGLDRGTHTLGAAVIDSQGEAVISIEPVTVHLHKASLLHPNNPLNPANSSR